MLEYVPGVNGFSDDGIGNSRISVGIRGINPRKKYFGGWYTNSTSFVCISQHVL